MTHYNDITYYRDDNVMRIMGIEVYVYVLYIGNANIQCM